MSRCNWCDRLEERELRFQCYWINDLGHAASYIAEGSRIVAACIARYCPMCGRKLREEEDHEQM